LAGVCSTSGRRPFKGLAATPIFFWEPSVLVPSLAKKAEDKVPNVPTLMEDLIMFS
jgi:hypothetical protein